MLTLMVTLMLTFTVTGEVDIDVDVDVDIDVDAGAMHPKRNSGWYGARCTLIGFNVKARKSCAVGGSRDFISSDSRLRQGNVFGYICPPSTSTSFVGRAS